MIRWLLLVALLLLSTSVAQAGKMPQVIDATGDPTWAEPIALAAESWGLDIKEGRCHRMGHGIPMCKSYAPDAAYAWITIYKNKPLVRINSWWDERTAAWDAGGQHVRQYIACHEIGHALGLPERPYEEGCMGGNPAYYWPSEEDLEVVQ